MRPSGAGGERSGELCAASADDWVAAMRAGEFLRAWDINDRHLAALCGSKKDKHSGPRHLQRIWRGEELRGARVLVRCYHGLGDTIQFARFLPALRRIAREVIVWCQPELVSMIQRVEGVDRAMPLHDGSPQAEFDVDIEIMEVPHAIRAGRELVALCEPYLQPDKGREAVGRKASDAFSIGLVWEVGNWDKRRSIPAVLLKELGLDGVRLYSLQRNPEPGAVDAIGAVDISTSEIEALALKLINLDLAICVDTMVAHLAGALGCEAWVMLHADCDWRWPLRGSRSIWYPQARLFHQSTAGDWSNVIDEVRAAIAARLYCRRGAPTEEISHALKASPSG